MTPDAQMRKFQTSPPTTCAAAIRAFGPTPKGDVRRPFQIERFAPGFRARVLARAVMRPADLERHNANLVGGNNWRRRHRRLAIVHAPDVEDVLNAGPGSVPLFGRNAARRRRRRHV